MKKSTAYRTDNVTGRILCLMVLIAAIIAYWGVQNHNFILYDDYPFIIANHHIHSGLTPEAVRWAFTTFHISYWHPLTWLSHILDVEIYGLNPMGHHLNNLILHLANTILVFMVFFRMTGEGLKSALVSALFALHPLNVESVAWVAERKNLLSTLFWLLLLWSYAFYSERPTLKRYLPCILFYILGLMCKPMLVTLPFVMLLLDYWPLRRIRFSRLKEGDPLSAKPREGAGKVTSPWALVLEKVPFFILAGLISLLAVIAQRSVGALADSASLPLHLRIENALASYLGYLLKFLWPSHLAFFYPHPLDTLSLGRVLGAGVFLAAFTVLAIRTARSLPPIIVGWFWFLGTLFPVIGLVQVGIQASADRYTYVPHIGLFVISVWGLSALLERRPGGKKFLVILCALVLPLLTVATWRQAQVWADSRHVFQHAIENTDRNYVAHFYLGKALEMEGKADEARTHFLEALLIRSDFAPAHTAMGEALLRRGDIEMALPHLRVAVLLNPRSVPALVDLGNAYRRKGDLPEALRAYSRALSLAPKDPRLHTLAGLTLRGLGRIPEAVAHFREALRIAPDHPVAGMNLRELTLQLPGNGGG